MNMLPASNTANCWNNSIYSPYDVPKTLLTSWFGAPLMPHCADII